MINLASNLCQCGLVYSIYTTSQLINSIDHWNELMLYDTFTFWATLSNTDYDYNPILIDKLPLNIMKHRHSHQHFFWRVQLDDDIFNVTANSRSIACSIKRWRNQLHHKQFTTEPIETFAFLDVISNHRESWIDELLPIIIIIPIILVTIILILVDQTNIA